MGGGLTKSAYYVIYISDNELQGIQGINENSYEPDEENFEKRLPKKESLLSMRKTVKILSF